MAIDTLGLEYEKNLHLQKIYSRLAKQAQRKSKKIINLLFSGGELPKPKGSRPLWKLISSRVAIRALADHGVRNYAQLLELWEETSLVEIGITPTMEAKIKRQIAWTLEDMGSVEEAKPKAKPTKTAAELEAAIEELQSRLGAGAATTGPITVPESPRAPAIEVDLEDEYDEESDLDPELASQYQEDQFGDDWQDAEAGTDDVIPEIEI